MERLVTVEFGPSRSKRFAKAVAEAQSGAGECSEVEPGRYRVIFVLGEDAAAYGSLAGLLERVRHWRATEVFEDGEQVSTYHAREMAWCASSQLASFRACRMRFYYGIWPRCSLCPLFDAERAIRDALGENPPPGLVLEITSARTFARSGRKSLLSSIRPGRLPTTRRPSGEDARQGSSQKTTTSTSARSRPRRGVWPG